MRFCKLKTKIEWYEVKTVDFVADQEEVVLGPVAYVSSACINPGRFCGLCSVLSDPADPLFSSITMTVIDTSNIFQIEHIQRKLKLMLETSYGLYDIALYLKIFSIIAFRIAL